MIDARVRVLPQGAEINYDLLPNLFMMAYDGFVINRRLNDIRDMERLSIRCVTSFLARARSADLGCGEIAGDEQFVGAGGFQ